MWKYSKKVRGSKTGCLQYYRRKKWEINQAAGRYIRSHEDVQRISIRNRLNDFMQVHGAELTAALAPELMGYNNQHPAVRHCVMQHSVDYLREALSVWLAAGGKINYSAQDNDILTAIGFGLTWLHGMIIVKNSRLHKTRITSENALNWPRSSLSKNPRKSRPFSRIKPCMHKVHGFACVFTLPPTLPAPALAQPEATHAPALKAPL